MYIIYIIIFKIKLIKLQATGRKFCLPNGNSAQLLSQICFILHSLPPLEPPPPEQSPSWPSSMAMTTGSLLAVANFCKWIKLLGVVSDLEGSFCAFKAPNMSTLLIKVLGQTCPSESTKIALWHSDLLHGDPPVVDLVELEDVPIAAVSADIAERITCFCGLSISFDALNPFKYMLVCFFAFPTRSIEEVHRDVHGHSWCSLRRWRRWCSPAGSHGR